jgi:hypothetical protein
MRLLRESRVEERRVVIFVAEKVAVRAVEVVGGGVVRVVVEFGMGGRSVGEGAIGVEGGLSKERR